MRGRGHGAAIHRLKVLSVSRVVAVRHRVVRGGGGGSATEVLIRTDHGSGRLTRYRRLISRACGNRGIRWIILQYYRWWRILHGGR